VIKPLASLRFLFALCVFLSHYAIGEKPIFYEGYIGVEFFFILSGFIISYNLNSLRNIVYNYTKF
jgi:peptidoglycan/LPS O-acetylase OafA/YrhL